jgi:hypothetical protein
MGLDARLREDRLSDLGPPATACHCTMNRCVDCGNATVTDAGHGVDLAEAVDLQRAQLWRNANQFAALWNGGCGLADNSSAGEWRVSGRRLHAGVV